MYAVPQAPKPDLPNDRPQVRRQYSRGPAGHYPGLAGSPAVHELRGGRRGLEIIPALQSEEEMAANIGMLLGVGARSSGPKPKHQEWLEARLAHLGPAAVPDGEEQPP